MRKSSSRERYLSSKEGDTCERMASRGVQYTFFRYPENVEKSGVLFARKCNSKEREYHAKSPTVYRFYEVEGRFPKRDLSQDMSKYHPEQEQWVPLAPN